MPVRSKGETTFESFSFLLLLRRNLTSYITGKWISMPIWYVLNYCISEEKENEIWFWAQDMLG